MPGDILSSSCKGRHGLRLDPYAECGLRIRDTQAHGVSMGVLAVLARWVLPGLACVLWTTNGGDPQTPRCR